MHLLSLATAVPPEHFTQQECWEVFIRSSHAEKVSSRARLLLQKVLTGENGIAKRHFWMSDLETIFDHSAESLNRAFEKAAPELAEAALRPALEKAELRAQDLDAILVCTCTGYLCPGISSYVAENLGCRGDVYLQDLVGLGCGAAIPTLRSAHGLIAENPGARVAVIAVEVCSAAFYLDNDPGVLISLCLFGDGAAASIWNGHAKPGYLRTEFFDTRHKPESRELLRFENREGKLRNKLHRSVPEVAAPIVKDLHDALPEARQGDRVIAHGGGRDVIDAVKAALPTHELEETSYVLRNYGNLSSPSVLFALEETMKNGGAGENLWLTSFGAGFAAHSCSLVVEE